MIQYFKSESNQLITLGKEQSKHELKLWINLESPTSQEIEEIVASYRINRYDLIAVLADQENPRVTFPTIDNPCTKILLQYPKYETSPLGYLTHRTFPISFIVSNNLLITISNHPASFIQHFVMHNDNDILINHEDFVSQLIWYISTDFVTTLNQIATHMDSLERQLTSATENEQIYQIMAIQKTLIDFKMSLTQNQDVINTLIQNDALFNSSSLTQTLTQVIQKNSQAITMATIQGQILEQYSNMVSSVVSNNLNDVMKILTSLTLIMTIPTIIGGIYGMNVTLPGAKIASAFSILMAATFAICLLTYIILKKRKYL